MQDQKIEKDLEKFINEEITSSKIWVFCGIMISVLLSQILDLTGEMYRIFYIFKFGKILDKKSIFFIIAIILEIFLTFFLPKMIFNKNKKIIKASFIVYSLFTGFNLAIFSQELQLLFQKNIGFLPVVLLLISIFLAIILIIFDLKKIKKFIKIKILEENKSEILEKIKFFVATMIYTDIVKILILLIIFTIILI